MGVIGVSDIENVYKANQEIIQEDIKLHGPANLLLMMEDYLQISAKEHEELGSKKVAKNLETLSNKIENLIDWIGTKTPNL